jgi:enoyl-[acyl-carrier protein] reductase III
MSIKLSQRSALITGSSRGIGRGIALKLAEHGVKQIAINYLSNRVAAEETQAKLESMDVQAITVQADVGNPDDITRMFARVKEVFGGVDIFVSNARAAITEFYQPVHEIPLDKWQATFDTQARAFLIGVREAIAQMKSGGRILAVTYAPGSRTGSWQPWVAMGSAKAALESLVRYFAVSLAKRGITVNAISPGATDDSVLSGLPPEVFGMIKEWHESGWTPMRRLCLPADVGNAATLLCTEQAGFITGQILNVDGGASVMLADFPLALQGV